MTVNYIIVDDEPLARDGMMLNCEQVPYLIHKGSFPNAIEASSYLSSAEVDLIFLDIEMPGLNGLDFIRSLKNRPHIILCTAYPQYALESYELDVIDYLVKPIRFERFFLAVNKVKDYLELGSHKSSDIDSYKETFMYIRSDRQYVKVFYDEVLYIKGMKDYVVIHCKGKKFMTSMNVKTILEQLPADRFARISKSYIIQIKAIVSIGTDTIYTTDNELPLGPSYKDDFVDRFVKTNLISR